MARHGDLAATVISNGTAHRFLFPQIKESGRTLKTPERILAMGRAARARIESEYTLDHYCARIAKALETVAQK